MAAQAVAVGAIITPQRLFQYLAAQHVGAFLHQHREQLEADRVELEQAPLASDFEGVQVVTQVGNLQGTSPAALGAAQHGFDARSEFGQGERFEQVIVGAGAEALQAVVELVAGGQHDHRRIATGILAQALAQGVTVDSRQHDIEHDQVVVLSGSQVQT
ncbi:hypothetical protein D3C79_805830 [compost metagenome]